MYRRGDKNSRKSSKETGVSVGVRRQKESTVLVRGGVRVAYPFVETD